MDLRRRILGAELGVLLEPQHGALDEGNCGASEGTFCSWVVQPSGGMVGGVSLGDRGSI